jgi:phenylacetate-CoA ligase
MSFEDLIYPLLKTYVSSPQWVKRTVGAAYSCLPKVMRFGPGYDQWSTLAAERDPAKLKEISVNGLRATLQEALTQVPFYEKYRDLAKDLSDPYAILKQLPTVSKTDIKKDLNGFLSKRFGPQNRLETFTGGSTSEPMKFFLHAGVTRTKEYAFIADFQARMGKTPTDISLALRGRSVPTAAKGGPLWMYEPIKRWLIVSSDHLERKYMPQYIDAMKQWHPTIISANPSGVYPLAKWLQSHPCPEVTDRIKGVELFGENLYEHQLDTIRAVFKCPVLNHYGHSERVVMAAAVAGDDRLYFWPNYGHVELVDDAGNTITEPGVVGEICGTSFDNFVMPFVRYRTGDMGAWSAKPSKGPEGFPVLENFEGRLQEFAVCNDKRLISVATLGAAHFSEIANVGAIQYEQHEPGKIILRVETDQPLSAAARQSVEKAVFDKTQGGCTVTVVEVPFIERTSRGKRSLFKQTLDLSSYLGSTHSN